MLVGWVAGWRGMRTSSPRNGILKVASVPAALVWAKRRYLMSQSFTAEIGQLQSVAAS
jgi:hypothetical protein